MSPFAYPTEIMIAMGQIMLWTLIPVGIIIPFGSDLRIQCLEVGFIRDWLFMVAIGAAGAFQLVIDSCRIDMTQWTLPKHRCALSRSDLIENQRGILIHSKFRL